MSYKLFICHDWDYSFEYEGVCKLLDRVPYFRWENLSVPEHDPLDTDEKLEYNLRNQIRPADVMVVPAGMYAAHSVWMNWELRFAKRIGKPILGVAPRGSSRIPIRVQKAAWDIVGWNGNSVAGTIKEMSRFKRNPNGY